MRISLFTSLIAFATYASAANSCPDDLPASCSEESNGADTCCVASPGILELSQIWDINHKRWTIDTIRILSCDGSKEYTNCDSSRVYSPSKIQNLVEGYARHIVPLAEISRKLGWGGILPDASDEHMAEIWAQQWATHGTCVSTFDTKCFDRNMPPGEEDAWNDPGPALFVQTMHQLHHSLTKQAEPLPHEPHQIRQRVSSFGSPHLGKYAQGPKGQASLREHDDEQKKQKVQKLSFFAKRDQEREHRRAKYFGGFDHEEL